MKLFELAIHTSNSTLKGKPVFTYRMSMTGLKIEFLHPKTPEYVHQSFYEILCFNTNKGLTEQDVIVLVAILRLGSIREKSELLYRIFDI